MNGRDPPSSSARRGGMDDEIASRDCPVRERREWTSSHGGGNPARLAARRRSRRRAVAREAAPGNVARDRHHRAQLLVRAVPPLSLIRLLASIDLVALIRLLSLPWLGDGALGTF